MLDRRVRREVPVNATMADVLRGDARWCGADGQKPLDETNHRQGYPRGTTTTTTTGWSPTCDCGAAVVPCTVLDPFGGSGTTGAEAKTHGRVAVLCEAQPGYLPLIARRIAAAPAYQPTLGGVR